MNEADRQEAIRYFCSLRDNASPLGADYAFAVQELRELDAQREAQAPQ